MTFAPRLRAVDGFCRFRQGNLGSVVGGLGQAGDTHVALERDDFGFARHAGKAEPAGEQPFVHDAVGAEISVTGLKREDDTEFTGIGHGAAKELRVVHRLRPW